MTRRQKAIAFFVALCVLLVTAAEDAYVQSSPSRLVREVQVAARSGLPDPAANPRLRPGNP